jgi:hypothetical protein
MEDREDDTAKAAKLAEKPTSGDREARLAAALRANLRRRKAIGPKSKA